MAQRTLLTKFIIGTIFVFLGIFSATTVFAVESGVPGTNVQTTFVPTTKVSIVAGPGPYPTGTGPYNSSVTTSAGTSNYLGWVSYDSNGSILYGVDKTCSGSATPSDPSFTGSYVPTGNTFVNPSVSTRYTITCAGSSDSVTITIPGTLAPVVTPTNGTTPAPSGALGSCLTITRSLAVGSSGDDVRALQDFLRARGYFTANSTGYFGSQTAGAVATFQRDNGLSAVGTVGPLTRAKIQEISCGSGISNPPSNPIPTDTTNTTTVTCGNAIGQTPCEVLIDGVGGGSVCIDLPNTLQKGMSGSEVTRLQKFLVEKGYLVMPDGATYGYYAGATANAVADFQIANGLEPVGIAGPQTRALIESISCGSFVPSLPTTPIIKNTTTTQTNTNNQTTTNTQTTGTDISLGVTLSVSPSVVASGSTAVATWTVANTSICTASGGWAGRKDASTGVHSQAVGPINTTSTFSLTCTGPGGQGLESSTVSVIPGSGVPLISGGTYTGGTNTTGTGGTPYVPGCPANVICTPIPTNSGNGGISNGPEDLKISTDGTNYTDGPISLSYGQNMWFKWTSSVAGDACNIPTPANSGGLANTYMGAGFTSYLFGPVGPGINGYPYSAGPLAIQYELNCNGGVYNGQTSVKDSVLVNFIGQNPASAIAPSVDLKINGSDGPVSASVGSVITLSWTSGSNSSNYTCSPAVNGTLLPGFANQPSSGSIPTVLNSANATYSISCIPYLGFPTPATDSVSVNSGTVAGGGCQISLFDVTVRRNDLINTNYSGLNYSGPILTPELGQTAILSWSAPGCSSTNLSNPTFSSLRTPPLSQFSTNQVYVPISQTTAFTLTAQPGNITRTVTAQYTPGTNECVIYDFWSQDQQIGSGNNSKLIWRAPKCESFSITGVDMTQTFTELQRSMSQYGYPDFQGVPVNYFEVSPSQTRSYTLVGQPGNVTATAQVQVFSTRPSCSISYFLGWPLNMDTRGPRQTLKWQTNGCTSVSLDVPVSDVVLDNGAGHGLPTSWSSQDVQTFLNLLPASAEIGFDVQPSVTKTYTLTAQPGNQRATWTVREPNGGM